MPSRRAPRRQEEIQVLDSSSASSQSSHRRPPRIIALREPPPLYIVDLSLAPGERYTQICSDYRHEMEELVGIYDEILSMTSFPRFFAWIAKILLNKVYSKEETKEIKGISNITNIPLHLVVAYNTFLDLFSGCMSGGTRVKVPQAKDTRMMHFRNLDWDMEPLRDMIIRVEYVRGGTVVARGVTYAGYVGVLTGVREGLSISMNYRSRALSESHSSTFANRLHHLSLLLGKRPSIATHLRDILLAPGRLPGLDELSVLFKTTTASSCYVTFCTPSAVMIVEKDLGSAVTHVSDSFLAVTNHDAAVENWSATRWQDAMQKVKDMGIGGAREILEESLDRKECMCNLWSRKGGENARLSASDLKIWLRTYPIRNESTHFSCIMDPSVPGGGLVWVETCYPQ
ncbi:hypothetical protein CVT24_011383 [Panaeolus cyanescens]|uniref:ceramidase n=1 Tax=Panaeolus cyanescens TaxID=181874 RepID=A0A409VG26_9AGAR|nr:hypothetical protein CVT24_011383 [Panaeolus cyanescens]